MSWAAKRRSRVRSLVAGLAALSGSCATTTIPIAPPKYIPSTPVSPPPIPEAQEKLRKYDCSQEKKDHPHEESHLELAQQRLKVMEEVITRAKEFSYQIAPIEILANLPLVPGSSLNGEFFDEDRKKVFFYTWPFDLDDALWRTEKNSHIATLRIRTPSLPKYTIEVEIPLRKECLEKTEGACEEERREGLSYFKHEEPDKRFSLTIYARDAPRLRVHIEADNEEWIKEEYRLADGTSDYEFKKKKPTVVFHYYATHPREPKTPELKAQAEGYAEKLAGRILEAYRASLEEHVHYCRERERMEHRGLDRILGSSVENTPTRAHQKSPLF